MQAAHRSITKKLLIKMDGTVALAIFIEGEPLRVGELATSEPGSRFNVQGFKFQV